MKFSSWGPAQNYFFSEPISSIMAKFEMAKKYPFVIERVFFFWHFMLTLFAAWTFYEIFIKAKRNKHCRMVFRWKYKHKSNAKTSELLQMDFFAISSSAIIDEMASALSPENVLTNCSQHVSKLSNFSGWCWVECGETSANDFG